MTIEFKKGNYISRIWMFGKDNATYDVVATLWRELPDGKWHFDYRFRYYNDDKAFDSEDQKNHYNGTFDEEMTEQQVIRKLSPAIQKLKMITRFDMQCVTLETDEPLALLEILKHNPWFNIKDAGPPAN